MERQKLLRSAQNKIFDIFPTVNLLPFPPFLSQTDTVGRSGEPSFVFFSNFDPEKITKSKSKSLEQSLRVKRIAVSKPVELVWDAFRLLPCRRKRQLFPLRLEKLATHPLQPLLLDKHIDFSTLNTSKQHSLLFTLPKLWEILQMTTSKSLYIKFF